MIKIISISTIVFSTLLSVLILLISSDINMNNIYQHTLQAPEAWAQGVNSIFAPRVPFGGQAQLVCICTCTGETLWRIGQPSVDIWPADRSEFFMTGPYTRIYEKGSIQGSWTLGMAYQPKQTCYTGIFCTPCGRGYPVGYIGTD